MHLLLTVIEIVAPVFLLACVGFIWVKRGYEYQMEFVTRLTTAIAVPALIFTALASTQIDPSTLTQFALAAATAYGTLTFFMFAFCKVFRLDLATYLNPLIFGNAGNLGLPLAFFAFGDAGFDYAIIVFALMIIGSFTFGIYVTSGGSSLLKIAKEPAVAATVLGALFMWQDWTVPTFALNTLELLGQIAIPIMLLTLGVAVANLKPRSILRASILSLAKATICIAVAAACAFGFGLAEVPFAILVLQISTPVAVTSYLIAQKYHADADAVAGLVVTSTLLSILFLPVLLAFFV